MHEAMRDCMEDCSSCHDICVETMAPCLTRGERHSDERVVRLLIDCAELCQVSANFMLRRSDLHADPARRALPCASAARSRAAACPRWLAPPSGAGRVISGAPTRDDPRPLPV